MSDFPMLTQFKATASPSLFFEERAVFSNSVSRGRITVSAFVWGSLIRKNARYTFEKARSPTDPTVLPQTPPKQGREGKRIAVTLVPCVGCSFFAPQSD